MAPRKQPSKAKSKSGKSRRQSRPARRAGGALAYMASILGRIPVGFALFAIGIGLGFGIGLAFTELAPSLMSHLERQASQPDKSAKAKKTPAANVAAAPPNVIETPVIMEKPVAPVPAEPPAGKVTATMEADAALELSPGIPAVAEEGAHQSAVVTSPPPDEPGSQPQMAALPSPIAKEPKLPMWLENAVAARDPGNRPMITIVLDDVGVAPQHAEMAMALPAPIVLSIMTYAANAAELARQAHAKGHEIMVHMPMQPMNATINPGPNALSVGMDPQEIERRVVWGLGRLVGYIGFNNHMGSRFTQDAEGMRVVLAEAKRRGLLFLDSKTIAGSIGDKLAAEMGVTHIARDVFLDDDMSEAAVARELAHAEAIARKQGYAVAIGHPHPATIAALKRWLPDAKARGFAIVPLTTIVKKREGVAG